MANMSYCRFQNTLLDLNACRSALENAEVSDSKEEMRAAKTLIEVCLGIADDYKNWTYSQLQPTKEEDEEEG